MSLSKFFALYDELLNQVVCLSVCMCVLCVCLRLSVCVRVVASVCVCVFIYVFLCMCIEALTTFKCSFVIRQYLLIHTLIHLCIKFATILFS